MNAMTISSALNYLDNDLIVSSSIIKKTIKSKRKPVLVAAVAAVCIAVCSCAIVLMRGFEKEPEAFSLGINEDGGMGFEGWFFSDISQAENGNPWNEKAKIKNLPVYENNIYDENGYACALNEDEQLNRLKAAADILGAEINENDISYVSGIYGNDEKNYSVAVYAPFENGTIISNAGGMVTVNFDSKTELTDEQISALAKHFLGSSDINQATLQSCNVYGEVSYEQRYFIGKNKTEKIISYNLRYITVKTDAENKTWIMITDNLIKENKIGMYPVISPEEAEELLLDGHFITSQIQYDFPGEEYIVKSELVYRCGRNEATAPYYLFYVELPEAPSENGLKSYGAYYVPAIKAEYVTDFPLYDGIFQ